MASKASIKRISTASAGGTVRPRKKDPSAAVPPANPGRRSALSAQKRAEKGWQRSEKAFQDAFEKSVIGKSLTHPDGLVRVNKAMAEMLGYSIKALEGRSWKEITHPDDIGKTQKNVDVLLSGKAESVRFTKRFIHKKGHAVWTDLGSTLRRDENGRPLYLITDLIDISARKRMEEALRESRDRLDLALSSARMGTWSFDLRAARRTFDKQTCLILGLDPAGFRGTSEEFYGAIHPEDRPVVRDAMARAIEGGAPYEPTYRVVHPDGGIRHVASRGRLTRGPDGLPLKFSGIIWDDTESKTAEEKLAKSEKRFRQLADLLPQTVFETDLQGTITFANQVGFNLFGYSREDYQAGINILALSAPEDRESLKKRISGVLGGSAPFVQEYQILRKDGTASPFLIYASAIVEEGLPVGLRGIAIDITERKKAEEQIRRSLQEKEILLREIYHRTKNNMNVISAMLSLRSESCGDEATARTLRDIEDRIKAMALVHQKLYESPDLSRIDMRDYLIDLTSLLMKTSRPPDGLIRLECEAEPLRVPVDVAIPLGMIVTELFSNVFKHALPENGEVGVRLHLIQSGSGEIELLFSDDGLGAPPGFDFRASQTLGLQTIFMLVEHQLQGRVDFQSGHGVSCRIRIPAPDFLAEART